MTNKYNEHPDDDHESAPTHSRAEQLDKHEPFFYLQNAQFITFHSQENKYICCHQMSDFTAKMHQIQFRLGLRPRPRWGSLQ